MCVLWYCGLFVLAVAGRCWFTFPLLFNPPLQPTIATHRAAVAVAWWSVGS